MYLTLRRRERNFLCREKKCVNMWLKFRLGLIYFTWPNSPVISTFSWFFRHVNLYILRHIHLYMYILRSNSLARVLELNSSHKLCDITLLFSPKPYFWSNKQFFTVSYHVHWGRVRLYEVMAIIIFEAFKIIHLMWNCAPITNADFISKINCKK